MSDEEKSTFEALEDHDVGVLIYVQAKGTTEIVSDVTVDFVFEDQAKNASNEMPQLTISPNEVRKVIDHPLFLDISPGEKKMKVVFRSGDKRIHTVAILP